MILDSWDQDFFTFLEEVFLDRSYVLYVIDVLVESRVDCHVFGAHCKSLSMLVLVLNVEDEWDAGWILAHHFLQEAHGQMDTLNDKRLIAPVEMIYHFCKLFCHE